MSTRSIWKDAKSSKQECSVHVSNSYNKLIYTQTWKYRDLSRHRGGEGNEAERGKRGHRNCSVLLWVLTENCTLYILLRNKRPLVLTASQAYIHSLTWSRMWHSTEDDVTKFHAQLLYLKKKKAPTAPPADPSTSIPTPRPARAPVHREGVQLSQAQE